MLFKPEPKPELMDNVPMGKGYPDDSEKCVHVPGIGYSTIASSSKMRHELASHRESMKNGLGMGILSLSSIFPFPFSPEVISESSDISKNRPVEGGGANNDDDDDILRWTALGTPSLLSARLHDHSNAIAT